MRRPGCITSVCVDETNEWSYQRGADVLVASVVLVWTTRLCDSTREVDAESCLYQQCIPRWHHCMVMRGRLTL